MLQLWITTALWAFSFSLIGVYLAGQVDSYFMVLTRTALASLVFLPWLIKKGVRLSLALKLMGIGAVQLGCMYLCYYNSFLLLTVPEVLLFTVVTPIYITLLNDLFEHRFSPWHLVSALIAVAGTAVLRWQSPSSDYWLGFVVVQGSNLCFAFGQVAYKRLVAQEKAELPQWQVFGYFFLGALAVATVAWLVLGEPRYPTTALQWGILAWLGIGASGLGYFLWNFGASRVNAGSLAVMNNALVPAGLLVNIFIWKGEANLGRLAIGAAVLFAALILNEWNSRRSRPDLPPEGA